MSLASVPCTQFLVLRHWKAPAVISLVWLKYPITITNRNETVTSWALQTFESVTVQHHEVMSPGFWRTVFAVKGKRRTTTFASDRGAYLRFTTPTKVLTTSTDCINFETNHAYRKITSVLACAFSGTNRNHTHTIQTRRKLFCDFVTPHPLSKVTERFPVLECEESLFGKTLQTSLCFHWFGTELWKTETFLIYQIAVGKVVFSRHRSSGASPKGGCECNSSVEYKTNGIFLQEACACMQ
ncbi:T. brucei spp.-specific protein [Trypanosoma brucei gambiense DAL972]|uniref:T. brucei spp.-specific protein n=1 Tax=Trypanosoma brucei gambiense (strain MHOM/CI/86/DAL972) TaxID=679716 RepID=C9ZRR0_TRYB9|nr:T. brucei spp.-specific protein [Trypanosoma brucei gambiense DAL972]CBH12046.1 T. brucei spp.-specific protein [Trypanosoma brucei gambiense DAL972]|eukprot:XP_011774329.1 T. brucei spp.-specific protein [Trypanosoma brucei gambiense DAL972]